MPKWIVWLFETTFVRWIIECGCLVAFEVVLFLHPAFQREAPDASLTFGILLAGMFAVVEISLGHARIMREESKKTISIMREEARRIISKIESFENSGRFQKIEGYLHDLDDHIKRISLIALSFSDTRRPDSARGSRYFDQYYKDTFRALADIIDGRFTLKHEKPDQIWKSHIYSLERATSGISFRATCLVPRTHEGIEGVFYNETFNAYCQACYSKLKDRSLSEIKKIFVVEDLETIRREPSLVDHLREIYDLSLSIKGLEPKVIVFNVARSKGDIAEYPDDFMIWGNELLATSHMGEAHLLHGLDCNTNHNEIASKIEYFDKFFRIAVPLATILPMLGPQLSIRAPSANQHIASASQVRPSH